MNFYGKTWVEKLNLNIKNGHLFVSKESNFQTPSEQKPIPGPKT